MGNLTAHAGIDPRRITKTFHAKGLPRTRGDRPVKVSSAAFTTGAPPHTRG